MQEAQEGFNMDDVKELLFSQTMAAYSKEKQYQTYIQQLEARIKELENAESNTND